MPYEISWYMPGRIMQIKLLGATTIAELEAMSAESVKYAAEGVAPVHAIVDQSQLQSIPHSLNQLFRDVNRGRQPNSGFTVIVAAKQNKAVLFLATTLFHMMGLEMRHCDTLDEALAILKKVDPTLDGLLSE